MRFPADEFEPSKLPDAQMEKLAFLGMQVIDGQESDTHKRRLLVFVLVCVLSVLLASPGATQTSAIDWTVYRKNRSSLAKGLKNGDPPFSDPRDREPAALLALAQKKGTDRPEFHSLAAEVAAKAGLIQQVLVIEWELKQGGLNEKDRWKLLKEAWDTKTKKGWEVQVLANEQKPFELPVLARFEFHTQRVRAAALAGELKEAEGSLKQAERVAKHKTLSKSLKQLMWMALYSRGVLLESKGGKVSGKAAKKPAFAFSSCQAALLSVKGGKTPVWADLRDERHKDKSMAHEARPVRGGVIDILVTAKDTKEHMREGHLVCRVSAWFIPRTSGKHVVRWEGLYHRPDTRWGPALLNGTWLGDRPRRRQREAEIILESGRPYRIDMYAKKNPEVDALTIKLFLDHATSGRQELELWLLEDEASLLPKAQREALKK